ncbi:hypothetical protein FH972_016386 [Carpinus fangiana]|uniref:Cyclic nucleotide-binding domain-containing protein n=1 Tax=Carpinus fangiana TaxID=176857 RepID=A0A5N6RJ51_9ROSI|nr:hypothetical protein FH972_016386 [Carpinus fangiana]
MAAEKKKEIRRKMKPIRPKIESWMTRNDLPCDMKERIINCIQHRLEENKDFDTEKMISHLSEDLITEIKHHICLPLLREVPTLENHGDQNLLERICNYLKPKYYEKDSYILQEGEPIKAMVFTTQGSVFNDENGNSVDDHKSINTFKLYGEELLQWLDHYPSDKQWLPNSTKTVITQSKVEAFALTANDLKHLVPMHTRAAAAAKRLLHM